MKILFVDDEEGIREQAKLFLERKNDNFDVRVKSDGRSALDELKGEDFDVIIADYLLPEMNGLELLEKLRDDEKDIPFILLTGKGKEEVAMEALNLGADKYYKKISDPKEQYEDLAKALKDVTRKKKQSINWVSFPSNLNGLLEKLLDKDIEDIEPNISESQVSYPQLEEILDISREEGIDILESLTDEDILVKEFFDRFIVCPECGREKLKISKICTNCGSPNIDKKEIIEHLECGYEGSKEEYETKEGKYICPKCRKELKAIGVDYSKMGDMYVCQNCGEKFDSPDHLLNCWNCENNFDISEAEERTLYSYKLNEKKKGWIRLQLKEK